MDIVNYTARTVKHSAASAVRNRIPASANVTIWTVMNMRRSVKIMLRRMSHDYIRIRIHPWNHSRSNWSCMCSDHVR